MGITIAKAAWALLHDELTEYDVAGQQVWSLATDASALAASAAPGPTVRLLPAFDTYLLGYAARDFVVPPDYHSRIFHGGEIIPAVLVDGCAAGTWHYEKRGKQMRITVTLFSAFSAKIRDLTALEADDIGRFFRLPTTLSYTEDG